MATTEKIGRFSVSSTAAVAKVKLTLDDPALYDDREGYDADFLGDGARVPLPKLRATHVPVPVKGGGTVLKYHNFSTCQSKSRRVPFYSACNINGKALKKEKRSNTWHYDPRIPTKYQIIEECYGDAADDMFSRGHMTRREDPVWGRDSKQAEADTFCVTNAAPQMQAHNAPIWLGLEDHVLKNAGKAKQRASVFTGPVLRKNDPVVHGVKIPIDFWKIVAFIHDDTDSLSAVAYLDGQADFLPTAEPTFVWGAYKHMQVPITRIEKITGLSFGRLRSVDVLAAADATFAFRLNALDELLLR